MHSKKFQSDTFANRYRDLQEAIKADEEYLELSHKELKERASHSTELASTLAKRGLTHDLNRMEETILYNVTITTIKGNTCTLWGVSDSQIEELFGRPVKFTNFDGFIINLDEVESIKYDTLIEEK